MPTKPMTKVDAIVVLTDFREITAHPSRQRFRRLMRAMGRLGLTIDEMRELSRKLDLIDINYRPYDSRMLPEDYPWSPT